MVIKKLFLHGREPKIDLGKLSIAPSSVTGELTKLSSQNPYLSSSYETTMWEQLRDDLSRFCLIDQVRIVRDKNVGLIVHFLNISATVKVYLIPLITQYCYGAYIFTNVGHKHTPYRAFVGRGARQLRQGLMHLRPKSQQVAA